MSVLHFASLLILLPFLVDAARRSGIAKCSLDELLIWIGLTGLVFGILLFTRDLPEGVTLKYSGAAFLALTLGYSRALLSMALLLLITQPWSIAALALLSERTGLHLLLASGEATLEGMIITILVVYFPRAVLLFDDQFYRS